MENIPQETRADKLATKVQQVGVAGGIFRLIKTLGFSVLLIALAWLLIYLGIPWYIGTVVILIAVAIVLVEIISLKRMTRVDLNTPNEPVSENVELELGEYLVDTIPAVMQYGKTRSVEILGTGKVLTPENALIITNRAIWTVTVPLPGGDKVVSGTDIGKWQWMMAYQDIIKMLQEMVATLSLDEVLKQGRAKRLMRLEEIKSAKTLPFTYAISLKRTDGKKFGYSIRTKEDYLRAKEIFKIS